MTETATIRRGQTAHQPFLDGWRGLAIALVFGGHFFHFAGGRLGVDVFFALSGLLMARILFIDRLPLGTFYWRRIARIFPALYLYLAVVALGLWWTTKPFPWQDLLATATFVRAYVPGRPNMVDMPTEHLWSLAVEEHGYIVMSLVAFAFVRLALARAALTVIALACAGFVLYEGDTPTATGWTSLWHSEVAGFGLFCSAALHLWLRGWTPKRQRWVFCVATVGFFGTIALSRALHGSDVLDYLIKPGMIALMVNTLAASPVYVRQALSLPPLRWLGVASFSLYLWQQPFTHWARHSLPPSLAMVLAVLVGAAIYHWYEKPVRLLLRNGSGPLATRLRTGWAPVGGWLRNGMKGFGARQ